MTSLILNPSQAEAIYSAMCALNNVDGGGVLDMADEKETSRVRFYDYGMVVVSRINNITHAVLTQETYPNQSVFATAYGLNTGA